MSIGYACQLIGVLGTAISGCRLANATEEKLRSLTEANLLSLCKMIEYNHKNNIRLFRISSDILPFGSHPVFSLNIKEEFGETLFKIGEKIRNAGMRVSMHPGQYTVLNSINDRVCMRAAEDLQYHADFLDALGLDETSKIILHIGGVYGDKQKAAQSFLQAYEKLSKSIKKRLVIENDDKHYTVRDVLAISEKAGIPVVFDHLHHILNLPKEERPESEWIRICGDTWKEEDGRQKIHYSQASPDGRQGAHSKTIVLDLFLNFYRQLPGDEIDIMLEVKDKNVSAIKCINALLKNLPVRALQEEWARYKYYVLSRSEPVYRGIQALFNQKEMPDTGTFYSAIESAGGLPENSGAEVNAAQHVWGYFKKIACPDEKKRFEKLLCGYVTEKKGLQSIKRFLLKCAVKYERPYLINSYYFYI